MKLQSRLEEEEEAKAALMGRIQRLTKLILVSTKNTIPPSISERPSHRRRHSFGEDEVWDFQRLRWIADLLNCILSDIYWQYVPCLLDTIDPFFFSAACISA